MSVRYPIRIVFLSLLSFAGLASVALPVAAQTTKKPAAAKPAQAAPAEGQPVQIGTFGVWGVFATDSQAGRSCFALARPKEMLPANLPRGQAYLFITSRPKENVRDEVSFRLGFVPKDGADAQLSVGKGSFIFVTKAQDSAAWLKKAQDGAPLIELMKKTPQMTLKTTSKRGNALTDNYTLTGLSQALDQVKKACP